MKSYRRELWFIDDDEGGLHQDYEEWLEGRAAHPAIRLPLRQSHAFRAKGVFA